MSSPLISGESHEHSPSSEGSDVELPLPGVRIARFLRGCLLALAMIAVVTLTTTYAKGKLRGIGATDFQQKSGPTPADCPGKPNKYCEVLNPVPGTVLVFECDGGVPVQCPTPVCTDGYGCGVITTTVSTTTSGTSSISSTTSFTWSTSVTSSITATSSISISSTSGTTSISSISSTSGTTSISSISSTMSSTRSVTTTPAPTTTVNAYKQLMTANGQECLTWNLDTNNAEGQPCQDESNQRWVFDEAHGHFIAEGGTHCLCKGDALDSATTAYNAVVKDCSNLKRFEWRYNPASGDHHIEKGGDFHGWCLDFDDAGAYQQNNVYIHVCVDQANEAWTWA